MPTKQEKIDMLASKISQDGLASGGVVQILEWLVDNLAQVDLSTADTYLAQIEADRKAQRIADYKQGLKNEGETDPYLNT